ncbi:MAG: M48 family peptidase [Desulfobacteraceae bacterium]|nr:MAG: M48 family peptidase [Desulfobacteraceae bacterium]
MHKVKSIHLTGVLICAVFMMFACTTVPLSGRQQLNLVSQDTMMATSLQQYNQFLKENKISQNKEQTAQVKRVGTRIRHAVELYFRQNNMGRELANYAWDFNLVESKEVNAWCMPGGKVVVYTGILPITQNDAGLAVVVGHEIAHAVAKHGNERVSQGLLAQLGGMALSTAIQTEPEATQQLWMGAFGLGAQYGILMPYSRLQENEADHLGLVFMAMAGYDPHAAVGFWQRMSAKTGGQAPPEFLSTHPAGASRIRNIQSLLPEAMKYYKKPQP